MASHGCLDDGVLDLQAIEQPPVWPCPRTRRQRLRASPACREQVLSSADRKGNPGSPRHLDSCTPIDAVHVFPPAVMLLSMLHETAAVREAVRGLLQTRPCPAAGAAFGGTTATPCMRRSRKSPNPLKLIRYRRDRRPKKRSNA